MTFDELYTQIVALLPGCSFGEDDEGQIVIYTNLREVPQIEELEIFEPGEVLPILPSDKGLDCAALTSDAGAQREQVMPRVGGKSFRCECGCNVFRKEREHRYSCNACGDWYASD